MSKGGYIKVYRSIQDSWIWKGDVFSKGQAWIDLILMANFADSKASVGSKLVTVKRGEILTSIASLAERWKWDRKKVSKFLDVLECDRMVSQKRTTHGITLTLVNYDNFQSQGTTDGTSDGQAMDNSSPHHKNIKNDKNDKREREGEPAAHPPAPKSARKREKVTLETLEEALAASDYSDRLKETVSKWLRYREEIKKPFKSSTGFKELLIKIGVAVDEFGETKVIDLINEGIGQGWHGIVFDRLEEQKQAEGYRRGKPKKDGINDFMHSDDTDDIKELERLFLAQAGKDREKKT